MRSQLERVVGKKSWALAASIMPGRLIDVAVYTERRHDRAGCVDPSEGACSSPLRSCHPRRRHQFRSHGASRLRWPAGLATRHGQRGGRNHELLILAFDSQARLHIQHFNNLSAVPTNPSTGA